jgi:tetratricopeptide (TPR) repeat protein
MSRISRRVKPIEPAPIIAIFNGIGGILHAMEDFDKLWRYADPAGTEAKFREFLPAAQHNPTYLAQLLTQIARAQGLQRRFAEAHQTLEQVKAMLPKCDPVATVRYWLEYGRVVNSSGHAQGALVPFDLAWGLAEQAKLSRYAIDAVHMIAIAIEDPRKKVEYNLKGIAMVDADPSQRGWLYALYNNLGEAYAASFEYEKGIDAFRNLAALDAEAGREVDIYNLKDQSRMLRALGRLGEAAAVLRPALERLDREQKQDGWISEEHGELLLAEGKDAEATPHFAAAYDLLSQDPWVVQNDPAKLERLRRLSRRP